MKYLLIQNVSQLSEKIITNLANWTAFNLMVGSLLCELATKSEIEAFLLRISSSVSGPDVAVSLVFKVIFLFFNAVSSFLC